MHLTLPNPEPLHWMLIGMLVTLPVAVTAGASWHGFRCGRDRRQRAGALLVVLCWVIAVLLIWQQAKG